MKKGQGYALFIADQDETAAEPTLTIVAEALAPILNPSQLVPVKSDNRRSEERVNFKGEIIIHDAQAKAVLARIDDVSTNGLGILLDKSLNCKIGELVTIEFRSVPNLRGLLIQAELVQIRDDQGAVKRLGFKIAKSTKLIRSQLAAFLEEGKKS